jgi:molybdopterin-guanine dinucleotide biosynthesis protein A
VRPPAIVLAGGASSRFGADKLAAEVGGRTVLAHAVDAARAVASPVVLVLAPGAGVPAWVGTSAGDGRILIARDPEPFGGPLVGLGAGLAALASAAPDASTVLVVAGDMPTLAPDVLDLLLATLDGEPGAGAATLEAHPPSVFPLALRVGPARGAVEATMAGGGKRSMRALLAALAVEVVPGSAWRPLDPAAVTLRDVDTPADLEG